MGGKDGNESIRSGVSSASGSKLSIHPEDCGAWHMIFQKLDFEDIIRAKNAFAMFDKDGSGSISVVELRETLSSMGYTLSDDEAQEMLTKMDADGNGEVDFGEFLEVVQNRKLEALEDDGADLIESYVAMGGDADTGGCIQADKLREMVRKFELAIDIEALIREVDTDGSGEIEFDEWAVMFGAGEGGGGDDDDDDDEDEDEDEEDRSKSGSAKKGAESQQSSRRSSHASTKLERMRIPPRVIIEPGSNEVSSSFAIQRY
jgi:calmodulin